MPPVLAPEDYINGLFGQTYFIGNINSKDRRRHQLIPHVYPVSGAIPSQCFNSPGTGSLITFRRCQTLAAMLWERCVMSHSESMVNRRVVRFRMAWRMVSGSGPQLQGTWRSK